MHHFTVNSSYERESPAVPIPMTDKDRLLSNLVRKIYLTCFGEANAYTIARKEHIIHSSDNDDLTELYQLKRKSPL